jgi:RNA polymerase sigma factor (sigma-70 family)
VSGTDDVAALVARAAAGEQRAYDALVDRFAGLVWAICRNFGLRTADAADVSQTVWLRMVEQLGRIRDPERVGAWLATTARHECLAVLRKGSRLVPTDDLMFPEAAPPSRTTSGASAPVDLDRIDAHVQRTAVRTAFLALDERCRTLLGLLHADPPATYDEITAALGMPKGSIGPTWQRCLAKLRQHPAIAGISGDAGDSPVMRS